jgi:methyltransferase
MIGLPQLVVALVALQRVGELAWARRNTARLRAAGAIEVGAGHYPVMVALHTTWLVALAVAVPPDAPVSWPLLGVYAALQAARVWTVASLGRHWTTRVLVLPGGTRVRRGPYRWVDHPNYLIVAVEIPLLPLAFGAWELALGFGLANLVVLAWRLRVETAALAAHLR